MDAVRIGAHAAHVALALCCSRELSGAGAAGPAGAGRAAVHRSAGDHALEGRGAGNHESAVVADLEGGARN